MSNQKLLKSIKDHTEQYRQRLKQISEEEFQQSPLDGGWSYSEVYSHIFQSNLGSVVAMEKCALGTGVRSTDRLDWMVWLILFFGKFPPVKLKAPEKVAAMVKKISKEEASNLIVKFSQRLDSVYPNLKNASSDCKVKHPRLGLLNGKQWFRFIDIHTRHHLKQLDRISASMKNQSFSSSTTTS